MSSNPPPAQGNRLEWEALPASVRDAVGQALGRPVVVAQSQLSGFSPGVAARLQTANGRRAFVKAIGQKPNPDSMKFHRREILNMAALPASAPVPRLLWSMDTPEWVVLVFEDIEGKHPEMPWQIDELHCVVDAIVELSVALTPSPVDASITGTARANLEGHIKGWQMLQAQRENYVDRLDAWSLKYLDALAEIEACAGAAVVGDTLLHFDTRADNILLTPEKVWIVDWPHACVGAAWLDMLFFAPSVTMQGGPPPEQVILRHPAVQQADPTAITAAIVAFAGFFTYQSLQPAPVGVPVRAFQAAQGVVAREWIAERMRWA